MKYECWEAHGEGRVVSFFPEDNESARRLLEPGAKLLYVIEADSWTAAMTEHHKRQGFEPYVPLTDGT